MVWESSCCCRESPVAEKTANGVIKKHPAISTSKYLYRYLFIHSKTVLFRRLGHLLGVRITSPGGGRQKRPPKIVADATPEPAATLNPEKTLNRDWPLQPCHSFRLACSACREQWGIRDGALGFCTYLRLTQLPSKQRWRDDRAPGSASPISKSKLKESGVLHPASGFRGSHSDNPGEACDQGSGFEGPLLWT